MKKILLASLCLLTAGLTATATEVTKTIEEIATANAWENGNAYTSWNLDAVVSVSATEGGNSAKYYKSNQSWRLYQTNSSEVTFSTAAGYHLESVTLVYTSANTGVLVDAESANVESGAAYEISGTTTSSVTFAVGNTGDATNGNVQITEITVAYAANEGGEEPEGFKVYFDNFNEWSTEAPHIWAWNDGGNLVEGSWPGPAMELVEGETTLYVWESESTPTGIIITNQDQTKAGGGNIDNPVNGATYYSNGTTTKPAEGEILVAVAGAFNSWSTNANSTNEIVDNCATIVVENYQNEVEGQGHGFKFTVNGAGWYGTDATIANGEWFDTTAGSDANIDLPEEANGKTVTFVFAVDSFSFNASWESGETPDPGEAVTYSKVTSTEGLTEGKYLIVYEGESALAFNGALDSLDAVSNTVAVTVEGTSITTTAECYFTIAPLAEEGYSIKSASGFYIGRTASKNGMNTSDTEAYTNLIEFNEDGNALITSNGLNLRYNKTSGQERFRYFTSEQQMINLYKEVETPSAVTNIESENSAVRYYNLQGVEVANPTKGIFVRVSGSKAEKVVVR